MPAPGGLAVSFHDSSGRVEGPNGIRFVIALAWARDFLAKSGAAAGRYKVYASHPAQTPTRSNPRSRSTWMCNLPMRPAPMNAVFTAPRGHCWLIGTCLNVVDESPEASAQDLSLLHL